MEPESFANVVAIDEGSACYSRARGQENNSGVAAGSRSNDESMTKFPLDAPINLLLTTLGS